MGRDYPDQPAPHRKCERGFEQPRQVFMKRGLVDHRASVLTAKIRRPRRQRNNLVSRRETNPVSKDVGALVFEDYFLDRLRSPIKTARPTRRSLDKFERHILVVTDIPSVDSSPPGSRSTKRAISRLGPGNSNPPRLLADLHLRLVSNPPPLIRKKNR